MRGAQRIADDERRGSGVVEGERADFAARPSGALGEPFVFGLLAKSDFDLARSLMTDLDRRLDYADWVDLREGGLIALSWAGAETVSVAIAARPFLRWCALSGRAPSERSLDAFAAIAWTFENTRELAVLARVEPADFSRRADAIPALAEAGEFATWRQRRDEARARAESLGRRVEEMPIRLADFEAWRACVGEAGSERALDAYAWLLLEELATEAMAESINHTW
ncbi:MAG TPA: hypothetical protein VEF36_16560 [Roseiarcus sp.]|nr:hypothetical protein [Roseiarcus sp.]